MQVIFSYEDAVWTLNGRKTAFHRPAMIKRIPSKPGRYRIRGKKGKAGVVTERQLADEFRFKPSTVLLVREPFFINHDGSVRYMADASPQDLFEIAWRPAVFIRREHIRIRIKIKSFSLHSLQDMTEESAVASGVTTFGYRRAVDAFAVHWRWRNRGLHWPTDKNSYLWSIFFEVLNGKAD